MATFEHYLPSGILSSVPRLSDVRNSIKNTTEPLPVNAKTSNMPMGQSLGNQSTTSKTLEQMRQSEMDRVNHNQTNAEVYNDQQRQRAAAWNHWESILQEHNAHKAAKIKNQRGQSNAVPNSEDNITYDGGQLTEVTVTPAKKHGDTLNYFDYFN